jgi:hypothetical protein
MPREDLGLTEASNQQISMFFLGTKQLGHEVDPSALSSAKVKNAWSYISTPSICLHGGDWGTFTVKWRKLHEQELNTK